MVIKFSNNARSGLAANVSATDTSITVVDASVFPLLVPGDVLYLTVANTANTVNEIIKCTAITGNTLTVSRGEEGTAPTDWTIHDNVSSRLTAELLETITARAYNSIDTTDDVVFNSTTVNSVQLVGGTDTQGTLSWNIEDETVDLVVGPNVTYQLGQELGVVARNLSGVTLVNGQVVKVTGASGDKITVDLADSTTEQDSSTTFAIVTEDITNNSTGHITTNGLVRGLDTSAFAEGVAIWLGTAGQFTATKPASPEHLVHVGWVVRSHATEGSILVRISNGWELDELHDVLITNITDNEILQWNAASSVWENRTLAEAGISATGHTHSYLPLSGGTLTGAVTTTSTIDGRDLSVDGAKLDGIESGATADQTASEILTAIKTVDGAGSGLDADLLDGQQGSFYQNASNLNTGTIPDARLPDSITSSITGNAATATKLATARTIALSGDVTGSTSFDGSGNATITATVADDSHTHDSRYYTESEADRRFVNVTGDTMTGTLSVPALSATRYVQSGSGVPTSNLGSPTVTEMALFDGQFTNKTEFHPTTNLFFETSTDGSTWTEFSVSDTTKKRFVGGDRSSGTVSIPYNTTYFRVRFKAIRYVYLNALYSYWSANGHNTKVQIFKKQYGQTTWVQHTSSNTTVTSWPGHLYLPFGTVPFNPSNTSHYDEVAVVFIPNWNASYSNKAISLYNMQIWGGYPSARRKLYSTDENKNVFYPESIYVNNTSDKVFNDSYHPNADKWTTARTLSLTGDVTGSASFDGSANVTITATVADDSHNHIISNVDGLQTALDALSGGIGVNQTWQVVTASRSKGITYTNSTGKPIMVVITMVNSTVQQTYTAIVGGVTILSTYNHSLSQCFSFIVPAGQTYMVNGSSNMGKWAELR